MILTRRNDYLLVVVAAFALVARGLAAGLVIFAADAAAAFLVAGAVLRGAMMD